MTTARETLDRAVTEREWQDQVLDYAKLRSWLCYHTYDSRRSAPGFLDLVLVRERIVFAELKTERGKVTLMQRAWLDAIVAAGGEAYCWRPSDIDDVMRGLA